MLIEITGEEELKRLLGIEQGYFLSVDNLKKAVIVHMIDCRCCNPECNDNIKPSIQIMGEKGEFWFSNNRDQIFSKIEEFTTKGYTLSFCKVCKVV
jgi:hypothetical protein